MRENGDSALFVSCGEVTDFVIENETLILRTDKQYLANLIDTSTNILCLKRVLRFLGYNLDLKIELVEGQTQKAEKDINFLKDKLGNFLKID